MVVRKARAFGQRAMTEPHCISDEGAVRLAIARASNAYVVENMTTNGKRVSDETIARLRAGLGRHAHALPTAGYAVVD